MLSLLSCQLLHFSRKLIGVHFLSHAFASITAPRSLSFSQRYQKLIILAASSVTSNGRHVITVSNTRFNATFWLPRTLVEEMGSLMYVFHYLALSIYSERMACPLSQSHVPYLMARGNGRL